MKVMSVVK